MKIAELLKFQIPQIEIGKEIIVTNKGSILTTAEKLANDLGYPDAAIGIKRILNGEKEINIENGTEGKVVAIGHHPNNEDLKVFVIETENNQHFLALEKAIEPLHYTETIKFPHL